MKRNLIQLIVMVVAGASVSCATFTGSSVASRNKAVRMILSSGNIDLINRKVAEYPQFREALIGMAISVTIRKGTPVQYRYAINHYPEYIANLKTPFDTRIKQAKKEIDRHCKRLLLYKQGFFAGAGNEGKEAFLKIFDVPELSKEVKTWVHIHDVIAPTFAVDDNPDSQRFVIQNVVMSSNYEKTYFKVWVRREVIRYIAQLKPDEFFKDEGSVRGMLVIVLDAMRDDFLREGCKGSFVIKAIWNHFLNSFGSLVSVSHVRNFLSWIDASQIMPLALKELGKSRVSRDITASRSCSKCTTATILRHYVSLMFLGWSTMDLNELDRAHNKWPSLPATLIRYGENGRYTKQCAFIMINRSRDIRDANSLRRFLSLYGKYYHMIPSAKLAYKKQLASIMISRLRKVRSANGLQKFLDLYGKHYHTIPSVDLACGKVWLRVEKLALRQIKRSTRIRATAGTRVVVEKSYTEKCVRYGTRKVIRYNVQCSPGDHWIYKAEHCRCNRGGRHRLTDIIRGGVGAYQCNRITVKEWYCKKYRKVAVYTKRMQDYVYVSFTIKNPTKVALTVSLDFDHLGIPTSMYPPTVIILAPSQRKRILHRKKRYRYSNVRKKMRLKRYRIVRVDVHSRNQK